MTAFLLRRLWHALGVVVLATTIGFCVVRWIPGDALGASVEQSGRGTDARDRLRARYGLDQPVAQQFVRFASQVVRGDLGTSLSDGRPVRTVLADALANSLLLSGCGLVLAIAFGLGIGSWQGWRPRSSRSHLLGHGLTGVYAIPEFVLAIAIISIFAYRLGLFPVGGIADPVLSIVGSQGAQLRDRIWHLTLPALTLALGWGAAVSRQQRASLREVTGEPFVRTARAKGVASFVVFRRHAFRASLAPVVVVIGLMLPVIAGGAVVVESLFAWPGMGMLMLHAVAVRDYPVVSGGIMVAALVVTLATLLADIAVLLLDPRQRSEGH